MLGFAGSGFFSLRFGSGVQVEIQVCGCGAPSYTGAGRRAHAVLGSTRSVLRGNANP